MCAHPRLQTLLEAGELAAMAARAAARSAKRKYAEATRQSIGSTLRPGAGTPLWNAVLADLRPELEKYGAKVNLGRCLALPRQRIDDFLKGRRTPDAERTLLILEWLQSKKKGIVLS